MSVKSAKRRSTKLKSTTKSPLELALKDLRAGIATSEDFFALHQTYGDFVMSAIWQRRERIEPHSHRYRDIEAGQGFIDHFCDCGDYVREYEDSVP